MRTKRDNQQWMLDLALNMRGRVQNFERDDPETPARAHNYRMLPKMWRKKAEHDEALAKTAEKNGFNHIFAQVRGRGDSYYNSSFVPKSNLVKSDFDLIVSLKKSKSSNFRSANSDNLIPVL